MRSIQNKTLDRSRPRANMTVYRAGRTRTAQELALHEGPGHVDASLRRAGNPVGPGSQTSALLMVRELARLESLPMGLEGVSRGQARNVPSWSDSLHDEGGLEAICGTLRRVDWRT